MYVIYIGHTKDHKIQQIFKKSNINYNNNLIYEPKDSSIDDMRNIISESQFVIVDITEPNIYNGIVLGIAIEKNIRTILITTETTNIKINENCEIVTYNKEDYSEVCSKIEKLLSE